MNRRKVESLFGSTPLMLDGCPGIAAACLMLRKKSRTDVCDVGKQWQDCLLGSHACRLRNVQRKISKPRPTSSSRPGSPNV
jgi:hypothetical protein